MLYRATHKTHYTYEDPVATCHNEVRLTPRPSPHQRVRSSRIRVEPDPEVFSGRSDYFGNQVHHFSIFESHENLVITATSEVEVLPPVAVAPAQTPAWEDVRNHILNYPDAPSLEAFEFTCDSPFVTLSEDLRIYALESFEPGVPVMLAATDLNRRIHQEFAYVPKSTAIDTPVEEVFRSRRGVCQDFAHVMIGILRSVGLAARYVSGYLRSGAEYTGAEASHAWVSIFVPHTGWVDLDPTNNITPVEGHVTVAWGRDYGDVTPVKGVNLGGGEHDVQVEVRVKPL